MKKISILLAVYNGEEFLKEALDSVLSQVYANWELIAVNNGSTDSSLKILNLYKRKNKKIKVFDLKEKGKINAYNLAYTKSSGDYFVFFAADDILHPQNLKIRILSMTKNFDYSTILLKTFSKDKKYDNIVFPKNINKPNFSGGSIMFNRKMASKIFPVPTSLPNEDTWASLFLKNFGNGIHISKALYKYRIHDKNSFGYNISFNKKRNMFLKRMEASIIFFNQCKKDLTTTQIYKIKSFNHCVELTKGKKILSLLKYNLPLKHKLKFIYYSSSKLYFLRNKFFRLFSGNFN